MQTIWKFPLPLREQFTIEMPAGAKILSVQAQQPKEKKDQPFPVMDPAEPTPMIWAVVDPANPRERRAFRWIGTGAPVKGGGDFIGTIQLDWLVLHLFHG